MLIFVILLHFGLKVLNISAAIADSIGTHICTDFNKLTNTTTVRWAVSSTTPLNISHCELICSQEGSQDPAQVNYNLPSHGSRECHISAGVWTIRTTCTTSTSSSYPSPEITLDTDNVSSMHICSDSGLGRMSPDDTDINVCIWRPELMVDYASVRWQPTFRYTSTKCVLHQEVKGQVQKQSNLPSDDLLTVVLGDNDLSVWVTCLSPQGQLASSGEAHYRKGDTSVCSIETPSNSPSVPDITDDKPTVNTPLHSRIGITNMAMGLLLAGAILIAGIIISIGFLRWFRWQRTRRRERLLRHGEAASDQSAMDEFQQMM
ncbi:uncharacterized protein LOC757278 [Strongylocentrotus purpuratus]|uniref:Uncharacterized protein n=1 Tax=Strongylocentrotus purpuratus TaxID=7668 RepID=A0A7M7G088_STRPU|nr:uncharacterized protein LOC757278 [Strongylocentrotus purpuratus]|eukprot:XP_001197780.2 PREDICTED: uncharacterized protein LOC757278 [Strongylocentrotus purpuratus]